MIRSQILMRKLVPLSSFAFTLLGSTLAYAAPVSLVTFVSGKGTNTGTCADPAQPCRSFQFAVDQTIARGEVKALDPANYGPVSINKSISITGVEGAGINRNGGPVAITINAGPNDVVNLSHLTLDGFKKARVGILLNSGGSLTIAHCVVRNFIGTGIDLVPTTNAKFQIADTLVSDNDIFGIAVSPIAAGSAKGSLDHVLMNSNPGTGLLLSSTIGGIDVTAVESAANNNNGAGFSVQNSAVLRLAHSAATGNDAGVTLFGVARVESFGDNDIGGNSIDVSGTLTLSPPDEKPPLDAAAQVTRPALVDPASGDRGPLLPGG